MIVVNGRFLTQPLRGVQRFAEEITRQLVELRDDVHILAPTGELRATSIAGVKVEQIGRLHGYAWEQIDLARYMRKVPHAALVCLANTAPLTLRNVVFTLHDVTYLKYPEGYPFAMRAWLKLTVPRLLRRSNLVVTVSEFSKSQIVDAYGTSPSKIVVIPNAVDNGFVMPGAGYERESFLAFYHPGANKNGAILLSAFEKLPELKLTLVGAEPDSSVSIPSNVCVRGRISDQELILEYQKSQGFIIPSFYEGFGIPPLEAQACGAPVIASDIPVLHEVLEDSAVFFDPISSNSLIEAVSRIANHEGEAAELQEAGAANVSRFSWRKSAKDLSDALEIMH